MHPFSLGKWVLVLGYLSSLSTFMVLINQCMKWVFPVTHLFVTFFSLIDIQHFRTQQLAARRGKSKVVLEKEKRIVLFCLLY